jgi:hypothetical protein
MVRISLRTDYSSKGNMLHQCSVDFGIKQFARALGGILCLGLLHPLEALALEAAKYDYVAVGAGWQRFDADQVSVDGEIYTGQLSWAVAKQAELTFRAVAGQFEESVDVLDAAIGGGKACQMRRQSICTVGFGFGLRRIGRSVRGLP